MTRPLVALVATLAVTQTAFGAQGAEAGGVLSQMWERVRAELERASAEREPALEPPRPVTVRWRPRRLASIDLGAAPLALAAADLDGDGRAELVALTAHEVVVLAPQGRAGIGVLGRAALPEEPASLRPRDAVGTLVVVDEEDGAVVLARTSLQAEGAAYALRDGEVVTVRTAPSFPLCAGASAELSPGRNYFDAATAVGHVLALPPAFYAAVCRRRMVDPAGRRLEASAVLDLDDALSVQTVVRCPRRDEACRAREPETWTIPEVGAAFELADVDGDGAPEAIVTAASAPGMSDRVTVYALRDGGEAEELARRTFSGGVIGVVAADLEGDATLKVVVAVRLLGSHRIDLWTLN
jgi:hypothetical protein